MGKPQQEKRLKRRTSRPLITETSLSSSNDCRLAILAALLLGLIVCLTNVAILLSRIESNDTTTTTDTDISSLHSKLSAVPESKSVMMLSTEKRLQLEKEKATILDILNEAGVHNVDDDTLMKLPTWEQVTRLYGDLPRIYGLETCQEFQNHSDPADHFVGTAGTFNSGTNLMSELMIHNCQMTKRMEKYGSENKGIRWQVPWGKHTPVGNDEYRLNHVTEKDWGVDPTNILPAVTIRDPYVWMQSMCRIHYKAFWAHDKNRHCPNLVPDDKDRNEFPWIADKDVIPVRVKYPEFTRHHESLVGFWNDWYHEYWNATYPRIMVRFEDLVFHAKEVTTKVCHCAGGDMKKKFTYIVNSAKKGEGAHGKDRTSLVDAMIRYGKDTGRLDKFTKEDLEYARKSLDPKLMEFFNYQYDEIPVESVEESKQ